jgi:glycosyltransferase involved in cell wall biosynthesis
MNKLNEIKAAFQSNTSGNAKKKPLVSVVVPAYNEEQIIEKHLDLLFQYMRTLEKEYRWELIVVNDGSTDRTGELAKAFTKNLQNAFVLHHRMNFRLGQVLRYAFSESKGDYVVVMDLDLSYSPDHIGRLLARIRETNAKIAIASPYTKGGKVSNVPWIRKKLSQWGNRFLCFMTPKNWYSDRLTNITGMVRAYDGRFIKTLNLKAMDVEINHEIVYKANILRALIVEVPAHLDWQVVKCGRTLAAKKRSSARMIRTIIHSFVSGFIFRPFLFFVLPGIFIFLLSLYPLSYALIHTVRFYNQLANLGLTFGHRLSGAIAESFRISPHSFIVGGIALMVAIQLVSLGFLALQKKRYFDELFYLGTNLYKINRTNEKTEAS